MRKISVVFTMLSIACSVLTAEVGAAARSEKSFTVVTHKLTYQFLADQISYNVSSPVSVLEVDQPAARTYSNAKAYVAQALKGISVKNYSIVLRHSNGAISICDMSITEVESKDKGRFDELAFRIDNCDGFMSEQLGEQGYLHFIENVED